MKFLVQITTPIPEEFGIMVLPTLMTNYHGVKNGQEWGADCGGYKGKVDVRKYLQGLKKMEKYKNTCLFVVVPDVIGSAEDTLNLYEDTVDMFQGFPVAFVAQNGQENHVLPRCDCLFLGGTTSWKMSSGAIEVIRQAKGKHIHIGRVNYRKRYQNFSGLWGNESESWTCDGTRHAFEGLEKAIKGWKKIMEEPLSPYLPLFDSDSNS